MFLVLTLLLATQTADETSQAPRSCDYVDLVEPFDPAWLLPMPALRALPDAPRDLMAVAEELARRRVVQEDGTELLLGDLVRRAAAAQATGGPGAVADLLAGLPLGVEVVRQDLRQLLRDDQLHAEDWEPEADLERDGILMGRPHDLAALDVPPWNGLETSRRKLQQGMALYRADLPTILAAQNDYRRYPQRPGNEYVSIGAVPGTYFRGALPDGGPFASLRLVSVVDLPFPFTTYRCALDILHRVEDGRHVTDVVSRSEDFYWLAGRDRFVPVRCADGGLAGYLVVKLFGFDLDGVPDGDDDVRSALRDSLGHLKREAEDLQGDSELVAGESGIPVFAVRGSRAHR